MDQDGRERKSRRLGRGLAAALASLILVGLGIAAGVVWSERRLATVVLSETPRTSGDAAVPAASTPVMPGRAGSEKPATPAAEPKESDAVEVTLTPEAVERAGIKTAPVRSGTADAVIGVPATVASNAYRDTKVSALVGGLMRRVDVELGTAVERGQSLAVIFSSELAEAQMKDLSMGAMLEADHRKVERTQKLFALGAASRQELEDVTAVHAGHASEVAAARQRLILLGLSEEQVGRVQDASHVISEVIVSAPSRGVVIGRSVNAGQVIMAGQDLFVVTDLASVWVIGDVYEQDVGRVRVGAEATVAVPFGNRAPVRGRIAYIDPRVDPATRTAKVRVEVPNADGSFRIGMFVTLSIGAGGGGRMTLVPRAAVQQVADRSVVYVPAAEGEPRYIEQRVKVGQVMGDHIEVVEGLKAGQTVVTEGSFLLRAEAARTRSGG
jgi:cobalt-zinc-cadmium efflux system membrane fusion protein